LDDDSVYNYDDVDVFGRAKIKKRAPEQYKEKLSVFSKIAFFFGISFLIISILLKSLWLTDKSSGLYDISISSAPGSVFSISIICIFIGIVLYFFERQFAKLDQICEEIENGDIFISDDEVE